MRLHKKQQGLTLIELLVGVLIGLLVILAVATVYTGTRQTYRTSEAVSMLEDEARFAVMTLRTSIQHAGFFGRIESPAMISGRLGAADALDASVLPNSECTAGWTIDIQRVIDSPPAATYATTCLDTTQYQTTPIPNSDILVVRRADLVEANAGSDLDPLHADNAGRIYLRTDIRQGELYVGNASSLPGGYDSQTVEDRALVTEMFYVTAEEFGDDSVPVLRRRFLTEESGTATLRTERIARNVEDFQVQFGEDTNNDGSADRFVDPPDADPADAVSLRIWLLLRSPLVEVDFTAPATFNLADHEYTIPAGTENFRRLLVTRTYTLRNR